MLDDQIAQNILTRSIELGATFADIFVERNRIQRHELLNNDVDKVETGTDFGVGIRLVYGTEVFYAYTNSLEEKKLLNVLHNMHPLSGKNAQFSSSLTTWQPLSFDNLHPTTLSLHQRNDRHMKVQTLKKITELINSQKKDLSQTRVSLNERLQEIQIFNSYGLKASDCRTYTIVRGQAVSGSGANQAFGYNQVGYLSGFEMMEKLNFEDFTREIAEMVHHNQVAESCPTGEMPVILGNGFGGVIFHEACGHLLETTSVAKKASVFWDKLGQTIASEKVTAIDDGTLPNEWGSINIDDEGMKATRTTLIDKGKLVNFMVDKVGHLKTDHPVSGSGRRQSYKFAPTSRMRNTFIDNGNDNKQDMIESIEHGIYAEKLGGGSVNPATGEFNFAAIQAYEIQKGKIHRPIKGATLIGKGPEILPRISMVGNDLALAAGMCGSVSGSVPVTVGQPTLKVDKILVGGVTC